MHLDDLTTMLKLCEHVVGVYTTSAYLRHQVLSQRPLAPVDWQMSLHAALMQTIIRSIASAILPLPAGQTAQTHLRHLLDSPAGAQLIPQGSSLLALNNATEILSFEFQWSL